MNVALDSPVKLKRSFRFWWLAIILVLMWLLVIRHWSAGYINGHYSAGKVVFAFWIGLIGFLVKVLLDIYSRYIKQEYITFDKFIIVDNISKQKVGEFKWDVVESIDIERHLIATGVIINFKDGVQINERESSLFSSMTIPSLAISDEDERKIMSWWNSNRNQPTKA